MADLETDVGIYRGRYEESWLRVHVACQWPARAGALKSSPGVEARRAALERAGFTGCLLADGLELRAHRRVLSYLKDHPGATALVVPVVYEALRVAALLGAEPRA